MVYAMLILFSHGSSLLTVHVAVSLAAAMIMLLLRRTCIVPGYTAVYGLALGLDKMGEGIQMGLGGFGISIG